MAAPLLARPCANSRALDAQRPANDATLLHKCCAVLRQGWSTFSHGCAKLARRAWRSAATPCACRAPRLPHARTSALAALGCATLGDAWRRFTRGDRALVAWGGLLGRSLLGAGWRRWRMKCTAAGRPMCAERRSLRAAVRRAWRDVARLPCENFVCRRRRRPSLRKSSGDVVTADFF
ncbi:DNA binding protein [Dorcoceras hygrometricum]|uniref:DNA binding protein n=1 Tax=Dorcoceras hygrometricum TaxID=472368 RepID=A0A2Z7AGV4_9LAMI|nr:DNA binding protein [Dorcoceras hygrometricum]